MTRQLQVLLAVLSLAASSADAQTTTRRDSTRHQRERILIRIDSLLYEFDHAPVSAEESERLRSEMTREMHAMEPAVAYTFRGEMLMTPGYLGVTFDGPSVELPRPSERVIRFLDYPRVSMVEPGSPAERGGVAQGDTLVSLNGQDVKDREISLTKLLVPDRRITVRVRRDGRPRDLRVRVDTSPEYMARRMVPMPPMPAMPGIASTPAVAAAPSVPVYPPEAMRVPTPAPRAGAMSMMDGDMWVDAEAIAGARLETVTEGLGKALGVKTGVLVMRVSPGTPAYESGLRDGDVILRAEGRVVASVRDVRRSVAGADSEEGVHLTVLREKRERPITLRW